MKATIFRKTLFGAAALAMSGAMLTASAQAETRQATVDYSDLDLGSSEGQAQLHSRVEGAVDKVCGSKSDRTLKDNADWRSCRAAAGETGAKAASSVIARAESGESLASAGSAFTLARD